eukprot:10763661-Alexandrium_andersonii.AAC.1
MRMLGRGRAKEGGPSVAAGPANDKLGEAPSPRRTSTAAAIGCADRCRSFPISIFHKMPKTRRPVGRR